MPRVRHGFLNAEGTRERAGVQDDRLLHQIPSGIGGSPSQDGGSCGGENVEQLYHGRLPAAVLCGDVLGSPEPAAGDQLERYSEDEAIEHDPVQHIECLVGEVTQDVRRVARGLRGILTLAPRRSAVLAASRGAARRSSPSGRPCQLGLSAANCSVSQRPGVQIVAASQTRPAALRVLVRPLPAGAIAGQSIGCSAGGVSAIVRRMSDTDVSERLPSLPESWQQILRAMREGRPGVLVMRRDNLVERPWGGRRLLTYKDLSIRDDAPPYGEAFEIAAFPEDEEASDHPSYATLGADDDIELVRLLKAGGPELLGSPHLESHGPCIPLLPKTLDVVELLSVQAHPPGQIELYVVLDAEPGATLRLGFREDVDPAALEARLQEGRRVQEALLVTLQLGRDSAQLQRVLAPLLARRDASARQLAAAVIPLLRGGVDSGTLARHLSVLHETYWSTLDALNEIPLERGLVILNATPLRLAGSGQRSAEIHALGNPERRESLLLEIRRPGTTLRAWDNVRFPLRRIDVGPALQAANLRATAPEEFIVEPEPVSGQSGVYRLLEADAFNVWSLRPAPGTSVHQRTGGRLRTLHAVRGRVRVIRADGAELAQLRPGESALVPACLDGFRLEALDDEPEVIAVEVP